MCSLIGLPFSSFLCLHSRIIHFGEFLVLKWKFRAVLTVTSQHIDTILILWLPCDSGLTQSSVRNGFEAHVFAFRTDLTLRLDYKFGTKCGGSFPVVGRRSQKKWKVMKISQKVLQITLLQFTLLIWIKTLNTSNNFIVPNEWLKS